MIGEWLWWSVITEQWMGWLWIGTARRGWSWPSYLVGNDKKKGKIGKLAIDGRIIIEGPAGWKTDDGSEVTKVGGGEEGLIGGWMVMDRGQKAHWWWDGLMVGGLGQGLMGWPDPEARPIDHSRPANSDRFILGFLVDQLIGWMIGTSVSCEGDWLKMISPHSPIF